MDEERRMRFLVSPALFSNASPGTSCFVQAKDQGMRDFRDAKLSRVPYVRPSLRRVLMSPSAEASN
jgi:hypothetical protein